MEQLTQKSKLYRKIRELIEFTQEDGVFPATLSYCEGAGKPVFTFTIERKQEDHFIDKNGQKWVKANP